jgi:hypothetical protein
MSRATDLRDPPRLRTYRVKDDEGIWHEHVAHFGFDNQDEGRGLIFRRYRDDNPANRTYVVASYAQGSWKFYEETQNGDE